MSLKAIVFLLLAFPSTAVLALPNNSMFETEKAFSEGKENQLLFRIENTNFAKNNEFFNQYDNGYTLLGFMVRPKLIYFPSHRTRIEAGAHILKYSGLNTTAQAIPLLSFEYDINSHFKMVLGTLHGALDHDLIEPIYQIENHFESNLENGIQFLYESEHYEGDLWVNWERFIFEGDPFKEEFSFGWVNRFHLTKKTNPLRATIPFDFFGAHRGGQIDSSTDPLETRGNFVTGLLLGHRVNSKWVREYGLNAYALSYNDFSPGLSYPYRSGNAAYLTSYLSIGSFDLDIGYWRANRFMAPRGAPIFQSVSQNVPNFTSEQREMLVTKLGFRHQIEKDIFFTARFEPYYDLRSNRLDYSTGIYLVFNRSFLISQL